MVVPAAEHEEHLADQRQCQSHRDPEAADLALVVGGPARLFPFLRALVNDAGSKPGPGRRGNHRRLVGGASEPDTCALGSQIDIGLHPRLAVEHLFEARRTGGAGHAGNREFDDATGDGRCFHGPGASL